METARRRPEDLASFLMLRLVKTAVRSVMPAASTGGEASWKGEPWRGDGRTETIMVWWWLGAVAGRGRWSRGVDRLGIQRR